MTVAPCKDCEKKGCGSYHSKCPKYKKYQKESQKRIDLIRKERQKYYML